MSFKAIIKANAALSEVYRSTGAKLKGISRTSFLYLVSSAWLARFLSHRPRPARGRRRGSLKNGRLEFMTLRGRTHPEARYHDQRSHGGRKAASLSGTGYRSSIQMLMERLCNGPAKERSARFQPGVSKYPWQMTSCLVLTKMNKSFNLENEINNYRNH